MFEIVLVSSGKLCPADFLTRIELLAGEGLSAVMLREKDLAPSAYWGLAEKVLKICRPRSVRFIAHNFSDRALEHQVDALHLPSGFIQKISPSKSCKIPGIPLGFSVHSEEEAEKAVAAGADYLTLGHIYETDCKKGRPGRGPELLSRIISKVPVPVYAIGGINDSNIADIKKRGAAGAFIMSSFMTANDPALYLSTLRKALAF
jgi:thiamine-phosphate pyrophosphorylase